MRNFDAKILEIIDERVTVLTEIERALFTRLYSLTNKHLSILSVHSITMIYSIWEGFIQEGFRLYIDEICSMNNIFMNFSDEIRLFHLENKFKQFHQYPHKPKDKIKFHDNIFSFYQEQNHSLYRNVNTRSNVGFETLNELLAIFNLKKFPSHWDKYTHPNPTLDIILKDFLRYRNGIAHGGDLSSEERISQDIYKKYKTLVVDLMYEIRLKFLEGLDNKTYLK